MALHIMDLPFNQFMGITVSEEDPKILVLPDSGNYANHVETVHAAALYALAEACSGHRLLLAIDGAVDRFMPLLRRSTVKYRKPARGEIYARPSFEEGAFEKLHEDLDRSGRALITIDASLSDRDHTRVLSASYDWFVEAVQA